MLSLASTPLSSSSSSSSLFVSNPRYSRLAVAVARRCSSTTHHRPNAAGSNWDSSPDTLRTERFEFNSNDDDDDHAYASLFGRSKPKQRKWWSEDSPFLEGDAEFLEWEDSVENCGTSSNKILSLFGWMLPAIIISLLLGTGSNAFVMALVVPLGQSALFFILDRLWESTSSRKKPRQRAKHKPVNRARTNIRRDEEGQGEKIKGEKSFGGYRSWAAANDGSVKKGVKSATAANYGGWDELDNFKGFDDFTKRRRIPSDDFQRPQTKGKLNKRRNKGKPLLLRLIIAVFPFLGSWTKLL